MHLPAQCGAPVSPHPGRPSFAPKLGRVRVQGYEGHMVHFEAVKGQLGRLLCGYEDGMGSRTVEDNTEVTCVECLGLVAWFDGARKSRRRDKS
jgi:hypothetical protein